MATADGTVNKTEITKRSKCVPRRTRLSVRALHGPTISNVLREGIMMKCHNDAWGNQPEVTEREDKS
jgi:hypothetical protein